MAEEAHGSADMRTCIRTGCRWPAAATLAYRYATAEVWLSDLGEPHPATHDLCPHHADDLRVPRGWSLVDDRNPAEAVHEPSAAELIERVTTLRRNVDAALDTTRPRPARRSRYADLLADLPTYEPPSEEASGDGDPDGADATAASGRADGDHDRPAEVRLVDQPVRELVSAHRAAPAARPHEPTADRLPDPPADGPSDPPADVSEPAGAAATGRRREDVHETGLRGAVVVQLPLRTGGWDDA